jgi:hypothetical protein
MGIGEVFPAKDLRMTTRFPDPKVYVDGLLTFGHAASPDSVDRDMNATRKLEHSVNFLNGITMEREIRAFSQQHHDNYHVIEYTFTNTGNVDGDPDIEKPDQTLEGVWFFFSKRWGVNMYASGVLGNGAKWGRENLFDMVGDGHEEYDVDFRAQYAWNSYDPDFTEWDAMGAPAINDNGWYTSEGDSVGRLTAPQFAGRVVLHGEGDPDSEEDVMSQPNSMIWYSSDHDVYDYGQSAFDEKQMNTEYRLIQGEEGNSYPHHADFVSADEDFAHPPYGPDPELDTPGGYKQAMGYGPYTLEPGDDIHIVMAAGADGLDTKAAYAIGRGYKQHWQKGDDFGDIPYDADGNGTIEEDERLDKNEWLLTGKDSLFQTFERAIANYEAGYETPHGPLPPSEFRVRSGIDAITLEWSTYENADPNGFEIYRTKNTFRGAIEDDRQYELIYEAGPGERSYRDTEVTRGLDYFYYIQAVGDVNEDPTGNTPTGKPLKSNRYFTQTYNPAALKREPGASLDAARVVPNPLNLTSSNKIRWPGPQDQVGFLNIPGNCDIKIFTERGDLVRTIEHRDGSGDEFWDLTTRANQLVVSGLYIAVIEDRESGETVRRKFVIIR